MIKGITIWSFPGGLDNTLKIDAALQLAADTGFEALELGIGEQGVLTAQTSPEDLATLRKAMESAPLTVETLASGFSWGANPLDDDTSIREKGQTLHREALRVAGDLGLQDYLLVPGVDIGSASCSKGRFQRAQDGGSAGS